MEESPQAGPTTTTATATMTVAVPEATTQEALPVVDVVEGKADTVPANTEAVTATTTTTTDAAAPSVAAPPAEQPLPAPASSEPVAQVAATKSTPPTPRTFDDLPVDIKELVVRHVSRPTELKALCLVNKQMHAITVRRLYRNLSLDVGSVGDMRLTALLNPNNIGLPHVRTLDLYLAEIRDRCDNQIAHAHFSVRMLFEFLPENTLEKVRYVVDRDLIWSKSTGEMLNGSWYSWHPWNAFAADNMRLLYRKQKKLTYVEAISVDKSIVDDLKAGKFNDTFKEARKIALFPDSRETLEYCHQLVLRSPKMDKLTLQTNFSSDTPSREINDSSTEPGLLTRTIFRHMLKDNSFEKCKAINLRSLRLHKINLRYAANTYCHIINFSNLKNLHVLHCGGADALFAELAKSQHLPNNLEVLDVKHDDNAESDGLAALDNFLTLVSGIRTLTMDLEHVEGLPKPTSITRHARTLTSLNVHGTAGELGNDEHYWQLNSFDAICTSCQKLEAISAAFPNISLIRPTPGAFTSFEDSLGKLPRLHTLHVTTWPNNNPSSSPLPRATYETLLQALAQSLYAKHSKKISEFADAVKEAQKAEDQTSQADPTADATTPTDGADNTTANANNTTDAASTTSTHSTNSTTTNANATNGAAGDAMAQRARDWKSCCLPSSKLTVIAFGTSDRGYEREDSLNHICYLKGKTMDPQGKEKDTACKIPGLLRSYLEPRSNCLDWYLGKTSRPPTREYDQDDEAGS